MPVHQLWLLLPVTALCVGEREQLFYELGLTHDVEELFSRHAHLVAFSSTKCRSKHLLLLTSYTSYQKAYCPSLCLLSMPSAIYFHELTFHPTLLWCDVSLLGIYTRQSDREKSVFEAHFPKTRPNLLLIG